MGRNVAQFLKTRGFKVIGTDLTGSDVDGDLTDNRFVLEGLREEDFDAIAHFAGFVNIPGSIENPYLCYRVNCFGTLNMLELARLKQVTRFIYASSNNVYGPRARLPVSERAQVNPRAPYDDSKRIGELLVESYHVHKLLPTVILRSWKMFGEYDVASSAVSRFVRACFNNQPLPLYNGGRDTNDFYHVENYCGAVESALRNEKAVGQVFNVGSGKEVSVRALAEKIRELAGSKSMLKPMPARTRLEARPMRTRPSILKIQRMLGYRCSVGLESGLKRTIAWFKNTSQPVPG